MQVKQLEILQQTTTFLQWVIVSQKKLCKNVLINVDNNRMQLTVNCVRTNAFWLPIKTSAGGPPPSHPIPTESNAQQNRMLCVHVHSS